MDVTGLVLTKNEEEDIGYCLDSLQWCDEIVVVDSFSTDRTVEIAEEKDARVFKKEVVGDSFDQLRNYGMEKAENEWIFVLDADEFCPEPLANKLEEVISEEVDGVKVPRMNYGYGSWMYYDIWPDYQLRLYRKSLVHYEDEIHSGLEIDSGADVVELEENKSLAMRHYTFVGVKDKVSKINRDTSIGAKKMDREVSFLKASYSACKQFSKNFVKKFVLKKGYRRGFEPLVESLYAPIYIFLREFKLWQLREVGSDEEISKKYDGMREEILNQY